MCALGLKKGAPRAPAVLLVALLLGLAPFDAARAQEADSASAPSDGRPPNIVFIMADDLGYGDLGSYGQAKIRTPNLDRMAAEGTRFTQFYAGSTVCAPSRSVLMTGQHTGHTPIRGNREVRPIGQAPLPEAAVTLAEVLQGAGYATGAFGKWGLGSAGSEGAPWRQGFDLFFGYLGQRRAHFYYPEFLFHNEARVPLEGNEVAADAPVPGAGHPVRRGLYSHDVIADSALAFIEAHRDRPFFLYVPFTIPHAELLAPGDAMAAYTDENGESVFEEVPFEGGHYSAQPVPRAAYAAMVSRLDRDVGRILDMLAALGLAENTVVFFTSDNGPHRAGGNDPDFFDSNGPLRGIKRDLYEGGIRVPMIAWGPGRVPAGEVSEQVWAMWDVLPTAAALAGAGLPPDVDGISMAEAVTGGVQPQEHAYLYWEFYEGGSAQAVRVGRWKAVRQPMLTGRIELYDLDADVGEARDVADQYPDVVGRVERIMEQAHTPSPAWPPPQ